MSCMETMAFQRPYLREWTPLLPLNTPRPRQKGSHFTGDIFKCIFFNENIWISIKILLTFVPNGPIKNIPALVQIMAWRRQCDKPLSAPMIVRLPTYIWGTRPQWVKDRVVNFAVYRTSNNWNQTPDDMYWPRFLTLRPAQNYPSNVLFQTSDTWMSNTHKFLLESFLLMIVRFLHVPWFFIISLDKRKFEDVFFIAVGHLNESDISNNYCKTFNRLNFFEWFVIAVLLACSSAHV